MRLYFSAESLTKIPCTVDTVTCNYKDENGDDCSIEFDVQGWTDHSEIGTYGATNGELVPWVFINHTNGKEIDYGEAAIIFSNEQIWDILNKTEEFRFSLYPAPCAELEESEVNYPPPKR